MNNDQFLHRLERDAVVACAGMATIAVVVWWQQWDVPLGVLAGGLLVWISYTGIRSGVDAAMWRGADRGGRRRALVKFFTRYAIVALAAYLAMVRGRVHPAGVVAGASSIVLAAAAEAVRSARRAR